MKTIAIAIAAAIAAAAAPAVAQDLEGPRSERVSFADLDLAQAAGRATLEHRVARAVNRLCRMPYAGDIHAMTQHRACRKEAWSSGRQELAAVYSRVDFATRAPMNLAASR